MNSRPKGSGGDEALVIVMNAAQQDLEALVAIDSEVIGSDARRSSLLQSIQEGTCLIALFDGVAAGFLTYHRHFYDHWFIELLIVQPAHRRQGVARALLLNLEQRIGPAEKVFSSTNRSNTTMQKVFTRLGYVKSGIIHNLDEGDPEIVYFKRLDGHRGPA